MIAAQEKATKRNNVEDIYPLSPMQQGLLFHALLAPKAGSYTPQIVLQFSGHLDGQALKTAWQTVIERHSILRTGFYWEQRDEPFQVVYRQVPLAWVEQDWQHLSAAEQTAKLSVIKACNRSEPFNLNKPALMRLTWADLGKDAAGEDRYCLVWCYHHLILDGWSAGQVLKEVFQQYFVLAGTLPKLSDSPVQPYGNYIAWLNQREQLTAQTFWQDYFQGWETPSYLTIVNQEPTDPSGIPSLSEQQQVLSAELTQQLRQAAKRHQVTTNILVQAALGLALSRYADTHDVVFGATTAGRPASLAGALQMVGLFINTLPVRVRVNPQTTVADWLKSLSEQQAATTEYEYVSLQALQAQTNGGQPLFDCLLVFESYPIAAEVFAGQSAIRLDSVQFDEWTHFPLTLLVADGEQLIITAKHRAEQISEKAVTRLLEHLETAIAAIIINPDSSLDHLSILSNNEQQQLTQWNNTATPYPLENNIATLLTDQADRSPNATALIFEGQTLTYRELHQRANQLAHTLQQSHIGPEDRVAIYLERSLAVVVAILAVIKAGAAYVPLDPGYPAARLEWMLSDADVAAVLVDATANLPTLPGDAPVIDIAAGAQQPTSKQTTSEPPNNLQPDNSLYVIYTSGSTGRPKGVVNTHRSLINRLMWMQDAYSLGSDDRVLHKTPLSFDVSVWELLWPLLYGATMVIAKPGGHQDSAYLAEVISQKQVTTAHFVPSMLAAFLEGPAVEGCDAPLKRVICSGEALSPVLQQQFFQKLPETELHNLYGPTEAAIDVTAWQCVPGMDVVPIGHPIANTQIHLLDRDAHPVPVGVPGEIYIGGVGVARGYLNRPELTAEKFVSASALVGPHLTVPSHDGNLYKTGDLARRRSDGAIEYLGRRDDQIKLRGIRIELGEIEAALVQHSSVRQVAVVLKKDLPGGPALVAYLVLAPSENGDVQKGSSEDGALETGLKQTLIKFLKQQLPDSWVPSLFVVLKSLPLTPSGKLNRRTLPQPERTAQAERVLPRNETEQKIAAIWADILQTDAISIHDSFFEIGGHSLTATRMNTRLRQQFSLDLPLRSVFEHPTIAALATHIDALRVVSAPPTDRTNTPTGHKEIEL
ncbi:MAG: amino acid adenylation domain-containing protein [Cyanobacteria bacterium J06632_22]